MLLLSVNSNFFAVNPFKSPHGRTGGKNFGQHYAALHGESADSMDNSDTSLFASAAQANDEMDSEEVVIELDDIDNDSQREHYVTVLPDVAEEQEHHMHIRKV